MNLSSLNWKKHVDVVVGIAVFLIAGRFTPEGWGILPIALGIAAYFVTQRVFPESVGR